MARAKLHYAFAIDQEVHEASQVDPTLFDPILRVDGDLPGLARPFRVIRYYLGPQGTYTERFVLVDPQGERLASSVVRRVELDGQMASSRFLSMLQDVRIDSPEEHELAFYLDGEKVGGVPVFVEAGLTADGDVPTAEAFTNAVNRTDTLTLSLARADGSTHEQTVWFVTRDRRIYVVTGPDEQQVPELAGAGEVGVSVHDGTADGQPTDVTADVRLVPPGDPAYHWFAEAILDGRVDVSDPQGALRRWTQTCELVELTPRLGQGYGAPALSPASADSAPANREQQPESKGQEDVQVDPQIDQDVYDQLIAEGKSERMARSKAKAAYVRAEKQRLAAEREGSSA